MREYPDSAFDCPTHLEGMIRGFRLETHIGQLIVTLIALGLGALLIYFAAS